jgi:hypothetical protein
MTHYITYKTEIELATGSTNSRTYLGEQNLYIGLYELERIILSSNIFLDVQDLYIDLHDLQYVRIDDDILLSSQEDLIIEQFRLQEKVFLESQNLYIDLSSILIGLGQDVNLDLQDLIIELYDLKRDENIYFDVQEDLVISLLSYSEIELIEKLRFPIIGGLTNTKGISFTKGLTNTRGRTFIGGLINTRRE